MYPQSILHVLAYVRFRSLNNPILSVSLIQIKTLQLRTVTLFVLNDFGTNVLLTSTRLS